MSLSLDWNAELGPRFMERHWRRAPLLLPGAFDPPSPELAEGWFRSCCAESTRARLYAGSKDAPNGTQARLIPRPQDALALFDYFRESGEIVTLLLNGVERCERTVRDVQAAMAIPHEWRSGEAVATLSSLGAGIGYHAGTEDGFVLQLEGSRRWRIWGRELVSAGYRASLCGGERHDGDPPPRDRPLLDCTLRPGDALYIPSLFPHWGETLARSVSLSLAWEGIPAYRALSAISDSDTPLDQGEAERLGLFRLLDDPPPGAPAVQFLSDELSSICARLAPAQRPAEATILKLARTLALGLDEELHDQGKAALEA